MMQRMRERRHGFTIIELLIVIAIIAILAAVAIPALLKAQDSGKESGALQVLKSLRNAEETYRVRSDKKQYGELEDLRKAGLSPLDENDTDPNTKYTFEATVDAANDTYTIKAIAPKNGLLDYTLDQTGKITQTPHSGGES